MRKVAVFRTFTGHLCESEEKALAVEFAYLCDGIQKHLRGILPLGQHTREFIANQIVELDHRIAILKAKLAEFDTLCQPPTTLPITPETIPTSNIISLQERAA